MVVGWVCYVYLLPLLGRAVVQEELPTSTILFLSQAVFIVINQDVMMTLKTYLPLGIFQDEIYSRDHKIFFSAYYVRGNFSIFIKSL